MFKSLYPTTFYRVSVKALITNKSGEILVVKENQDTWSLPGGGLDHGEEPQLGIRREIKEELGIETVHSMTVHCIKTFYLAPRQTWLMWVVYRVTIEPQEFIWGDGVTDVAFIPPAQLRDSTDVFEQTVYEISRETLSD